MQTVIQITNANYDDLMNDITKLVRNQLIDVIGNKPEPEKQDEYLSRYETLDLLKIQNSTLYQLTKAGKIPYYRFGRKMLFKKSEIEEYLNRIKQEN